MKQVHICLAIDAGGSSPETNRSGVFFGVLLELYSDQGRNFELLQGLCYLLSIRKTRTTPLHPQSVGMIEKFNKVIEQHLSTSEGLGSAYSALLGSVQSNSTGQPPSKETCGVWISNRSKQGH